MWEKWSRFFFSPCDCCNTLWPLTQTVLHFWPFILESFSRCTAAVEWWMRPSPRDALFSEASDSLTISLFYMFGFFYLFTSAQSANCRPFLHYILWDLFCFWHRWFFGVFAYLYHFIGGLLSALLSLKSHCLMVDTDTWVYFFPLKIINFLLLLFTSKVNWLKMYWKIERKIFFVLLLLELNI